MTIITKVIKKVMLYNKPDKLLVFSDPEETGAIAAEVERSPSDEWIRSQQGRKWVAVTIFFFFLLILITSIVGIGFHVQYMRDNHRQWRGVCGFPYDGKDMDNEVWSYNQHLKMDENANNLLQALFADDSDTDTGFGIDIADMETDVANEVRKDQERNNRHLENQYFREVFDLDMTDESSYADVKVPDFRDGRSGRYLHDFKYNQSAIIDKDKRCFIMDLDRETVAPPRDLFDMITKMYSGYFDINTDVVRKEMRVVLPPLDEDDKKEVSPRIVGECRGLNMYRLEKFVGGVMKRSIHELQDEQKFGGQFGKNIVEYDLVNIDAVQAYEKQAKH